MQVLHYLTAFGVDPFQSWLDRLGDQKARVTILGRVNRLLADNYGDHKFVRDGVWEMRIDVGAGYRMYYSKPGNTAVLLLCCGPKRTQRSDIARAVAFWTDFRGRRG